MKDWCNKDGAERLREQIACYWQERGYEVDVNLVDAGFVPAMRSARTDVRSNMVNGMPSRSVLAQKPSSPSRNTRELGAQMGELMASNPYGAARAFG